MQPALRAKKEALIALWESAGTIKDKRIIEAFRSVPREKFVREQDIGFAYVDYPLPLPAGQTISQPTTVMLMTQALDVSEGMSVLEIGAGSGYQAAILSKLVGKAGSVYSIETVPDLVSYAQRSLRAAGIQNVTVSYGDGSQGFSARAPYDRIIVTAAAPRVPPPLIEQLKDGGILLIPVDSPYGFGQIMKKITKHGNATDEEELGEFAFVPLTGKYGKN